MRRLTGSGGGGGNSRDVTTDADSLRSDLRGGGVGIIDVRRRDEYVQGHIPGAVNLPLADLLSDDDPKRVAALAGSLGIGDDTPVVVYDDTFGALASRVAWTLEHAGHRDVRLLDTTYGMWRSMGLESDTAVPTPGKRSHSVDPRPGMLATAGYLDGARGRDGVVLLDNRERLNYLEQHIPGAVSLPYMTLSSSSPDSMLPDRILRPPGEMRRLLEGRGISSASEVITYCGSVGTLSGLAYYALKSVGMDNVRLYVRSFREWKGLDKPVQAQPDANYWDLSAE